jgi:D-alanyl-D-alanine carboxypeptidase/D-alanyl-D-alanine-endopeptidase (penicillin-binding protein 4)
MGWMSRFGDMGSQDLRAHYDRFWAECKLAGMPNLSRFVLALALLSTTMLAQQPVAAPKLVVHPAFPTGAETPLGRQVTALLADPSVSRAHWGIAVTALDGTPIYGLDEGKLFRPASNAKLFTTAAAMALLGPDVRVSTSVDMLSNPAEIIAHPTQPFIRSGVFDGVISINGDGDAFVSDRPAKYVSSYAPGQGKPLQFIEDAASAIAALGVTTVKGTINGNALAWTGDPWGETWSREDVAWGYGAPVSALTINDNQLRLTLTPSQNIHSDTPDYHVTVQIYPDTGFYTIKADVFTVAGQAANINVDHPDGPRSLRIVGHIPPGAPYVTEIAIDDPPLFAAEELKSALERHGVTVQAEVETAGAGWPIRPSEPEPDLPANMKMHTTEQATQQESEEQSRQMCAAAGIACKIVAEHVSPTMAEDVVWTLKESQNLHAEMLLRRVAYRYGNNPTAADGTWAMRQWLIESGLDRDDFVFYDGSGLSPKDLVTPRATAQLLSFATTQPWFAQWKSALPVGGVDGTLASRFKDAPLKGHVFAKTGTLGESRALSGYLDCTSGQQVIFSIMVDNHAPAGSADRAVMDKIAAAIASTQ